MFQKGGVSVDEIERGMVASYLDEQPCLPAQSFIAQISKN